MATQPSFMKMPFAANGEREIIPETSSDGHASLSAGFPQETSMPIEDGGIPPRRVDFNGILYTLSMFSMFQQAGGKFTYNTQVNYDVPSIIYYDGDLWWCLQSNGPATTVVTPGSNPTYWTKLKNYLSSPLDAYPVGSYYISSNSTSPAVLFGGVWEQIRDRMILAAGLNYSAGATGGSATKTLVTENLPSHSHSCNTAGNHTHERGTMNITGTLNVGANGYYVDGAFTQEATYQYPHIDSNVGAGGLNYKFDASRSWEGETSENGNHQHTIGNTGNSAPLDIMPPYIVAYVWRRTA